MDKAKAGKTKGNGPGFTKEINKLAAVALKASREGQKFETLEYMAFIVREVLMTRYIRSKIIVDALGDSLVDEIQEAIIAVQEAVSSGKDDGSA